VQAGVWPIGGVFDETVFDRVVMDVIDMVAVVGFIPDQVFPKTALPYPAFAAPLAYGRTMFGGRDRIAEGLLDSSPAAGEIAVAGRQGDDAMQMLGQDHPGVDAETSPSRGVQNGMLEETLPPDEQVVAASFEQVHREEVGAALVAEASVIGHDTGMWLGSRIVFGVAVAGYRGCRVSSSGNSDVVRGVGA